MRKLALAAVLLLSACLPDERRYWIRYADQSALARSARAELAQCLPQSARDIVIHHDRLLGRQHGTFTFKPDESMVSRQFVDADQSWPAGARLYRCANAPYLVAVDQSAGTGQFRLDR